MISFIRGKLIDIVDNALIIENNNIGFEIFFPSSNFVNLPQIGDVIEIYTYMLVKEDDIRLYGFLTKEDREMFLKLITVNGVGPKGALKIISDLGFSTLAEAILKGDKKTIAGVSGIGSKTAEKIVIDLQDKVKKLNFDITNDIINKNNQVNDKINQIRQDAIDALVALEWTKKAATDIINGIKIDENMTVNDLLKIAFKKK